MLLGAAIGDALGWPHETRGTSTRSSVNGVSLSSKQPVFAEWVRATGSRYQRLEEPILPGEISDDTQLLLCTARSLQSTQHWFDHLTLTELPAWLLYERGGGRAVKQAARSWSRGQPPWTQADPKDRSAYFEAGGNGAAMRIAPHVLRCSDQEDFEECRKQVVRDAMATHGHPRALLGASLHAFALWVSLHVDAPVPYGYLVSECCSRFDAWSACPSVPDVPEGWFDAWRREAHEEFESVWTRVGAEVRSQLTHVDSAIGRGSLAISREVLDELGCTRQSTRGTGTISAAAAIFLATRHAADPMQAMIEAAFLKGADTDTLASLTGSLLCAALGTRNWLDGLAEAVEDSTYLRSVAASLRVGPTTSDPAIRVTDRSVSRFRSKLPRLDVGEIIELPDGRKAEVVRKRPVLSRSQKLGATGWTFKTLDGQTLHIIRTSRNKPEADPALKDSGPMIEKIGIKIFVTDLDKVRQFYENVIGLTVTRQLEHRVNFDEAVTLIQTSRAVGRIPPDASQMVLYIRVTSISDAIRRAEEQNVRIVAPLTESGGDFFRCLDPEGTVVEVSSK